MRCARDKTIDWNLKGAAPVPVCALDREIDLLWKYDYPPEGQEDALSAIMKQCDMWSENG